MGLATLVILLACTWPLAIHPTSLTFGPSHNDFYSIAWGLDYVARALAQGHLPSLHTDSIAFPVGATLAVADLPEMLLMAPITILFGPTVSFNLLQLLHHVLAAMAAWWCARRLACTPAGAALVAVAFAFSPALVSSTFNQNPDVTAWYWVPLTAGLATGSRSWRQSILAALAAEPSAGPLHTASLLLPAPLLDALADPSAHRRGDV